MKRALYIVFGTFFFVFGVLGALIFGIAQGSLTGKIVGIGVGIVAALFGVWLMRHVEKSFTKLFEAVLDLLLLNWP